MPAPSHSDPLPERLRPAARFILRRSLADDIPDFADGRLDADPELKAMVEEVLRTDPEARRQLAEYTQLRDSLTKVDMTALTSRSHARVQAGELEQEDAAPFSALLLEEPPAPSKIIFHPLVPNPTLKMTARVDLLPQVLEFTSPRLPGFTGVASGSVRRPGAATMLSLSREVTKAGEEPPPEIAVVWPGGTSDSHEFREHYGRWVVELEVEVPWRTAVAMLKAGQVEVALREG